MKILLAVDGSRCTKRMLAYLVTHEEWLHPSNEFIVFHGVPALPHRAAAFATPGDIEAVYDSDAETVLKPVRTFLQRHGIQARFVHAVGRPAHEIARLAQRRRVDLIMIGSHGHGALGATVLGSVATQVVALAKAPVLIVR